MNLDEFKTLVNERHITDITAVETYLTDESKLADLTPEKLYDMGLFTHTSYEVSESEADDVMNSDDVDDTTTLKPEVPTDDVTEAPTDDVTEAPTGPTGSGEDIIVDDGSEDE